MKFSSVHSGLNLLHSVSNYDNSSNSSAEQVNSYSSLEHYRKSVEMHSNLSSESKVEVHQMAYLKKSWSLGSELNREGRVSSSNDTEDEINQGFLCDLFEETNLPGSFDAFDQNGSSKPLDNNDPGMNDVNPYHEGQVVKQFQGNVSSAHNVIVSSIGDQKRKELVSDEFKIKRIEEWIRKIDIEDTSFLQETSESLHLNETLKKSSDVLGSVTTSKLDAKIIHGMEPAQNYISSLNATSSSAQLTNLGLVVIPFLSTFVSLRVLNLSGNGIVRITAGALPRGLHMLNLAKNNISTIEGLREVRHLRVLDLSYNRISRIGHGLASCSSLKELYLANNKISEVEGLHRLLKLNILDLSFNKISTTKCLRQLAANYISLQGINLEGNPAQRNVGDQQLKKYLQGLVFQLIYYNKEQPSRASLAKDIADRPIRSAITAHQFDRTGTHHFATNKASYFSSCGHTIQTMGSSKRSWDKHQRLPPRGTKRIHHCHHYLNLGNNLLSLRMNLSMHCRSRSEGNLGDS